MLEPDIFVNYDFARIIPMAFLNRFGEVRQTKHNKAGRHALAEMEAPVYNNARVLLGLARFHRKIDTAPRTLVTKVRTRTGA